MKQIYLIKNIVNDMCYVGQADNAYDRFRRHRNNHISSDKQNIEIVKAMKELGKDNFFFVILENCEDHEADEREKYYIEKYNSYKHGYNRTIGGSGTNTITKEDISKMCELFEQNKLINEIETLIQINHKTIKKELMKVYPDYEQRVKENSCKARMKSKGLPVIQYDLGGNFIARFDSINDALRHLGKSVKSSSITYCCKGIKNYNTAYGYKWKYE